MPFLLGLRLHRPNQFRWSAIQSPAQSENRIHSGHTQAPFDQGNISPFKSGDFGQLFLRDARIAPQSGEYPPNDAFQVLRLIQ